MIKAITYADEGYKAITDRTMPHLRQHFERQSIPLNVYSERIDYSLDIFWNRIPMVLRELSGADFLIWTDTDMVYRRDFDWAAYVAQFPDANIWISGETKPTRADVCCGFMIFRACVWTYDFLQTWKFLGPMREAKVGVYCNWNRREQETFNIMWDWFEGVHKRVQRITENIVANPLSAQADKDASVMFHFWGKNYQEIAFKMLEAWQSSNAAALKAEGG